MSGWWSRLLRKPVEPTRIIVIGHDIADARRACQWLDVSPKAAKSAQTLLMGFSQQTVFYVTPYCAQELHGELKAQLDLHAALDGTVIWMEPYG